jgi:hypothetical protein
MREEIMNRKKQNERGVALLLAIFALVIVTSIALGMMYLSDSETIVDSNFRDEQTAYYAARAGLEEARDRMRSTSGSGITINASLPTAKPGAAGGVLYILNPTGSETVAPWTTTNAYFDDEICKEVSCGGGQVPPTSGWYLSPALTAGSTYAASPVLPYKWMRITLKTDQSAVGTSNIMYVDGNSADAAYYVCWNGTNEVTSSTACASPNNPVYMVTTLAVTPRGTRRMLQYEVTQDSINLTLPAALTLDGPIPAGASSICGSGSTCNSGGAYLTGDEPSSGCPTGGTVPAIGTADPTSNANLVTAITSNKGNIVGSGGSPSVVNESSALTNLSTVAEVEALVTTMKGLAGSNVGSDCTTLNLGTSASPTITVVTNDPVSSGVSGGVGCNLTSGVTGYGILVVTGELQYVNVNSYQGIILMLGQAELVSSSSKDTTLTGALFMAADRNSTTGALLATLGTPGFNFHHGSASSTDPSIQYNQCLIDRVSTLSDYRMIASHELLY